MVRLLMLALASWLLAQPALANCPAQPLPSVVASAGWPKALPSGEVLRFSARPTLLRYAYAVQIVRRSEGAPATVDVVRLRPFTNCNLYHRERTERFTLSGAEATRFFADLAALEAAWREPDEIATDGTGFEYLHRRGSGLRALALSNSVTGLTERISALVLAAATAPETETFLPRGPAWYDLPTGR